MPCPPAWLAMDASACADYVHPSACTGDLRQTCALRRLSSRAVCITCGLRRPSCIRLAADITLGLAPPCYILQSSCPALPTAFAPSYPGQFSQRFSFRLAPSSALSGRASDQLEACAPGPSSARTSDPLRLSSRAAHLTRPHCNSWLAPQVTCFWQRRQFNSRLAPDVASFDKAGDQFPVLGWRPHPRLAPAACLPPTSVP